MLISYSMPAVSTAAITGGTWLTSDGAAALWDGKPSRRARLQWSAGSALGGYVEITLNFSASSFLRVFALLGSTLPAGVRIVFGGSVEARTGYQPDTTAGAWGVAAADGAPVASCTVRIYNDRNGAPWAANGTIIDIGELWAGPAVEIGIRDGWDVQTVDPTEITRNRGGQANAVARSAYRVLSANFAGLSAAAARGEALANGMDLERVTAALRGGARCAVIPHYRNMTTRALDPQAIARSAIYGYASQLPNIANISRGYFTGQLVVEEIPAR